MRDTAHPLPLDPALPGWITAALIATTRATFQPYYAETLTDEETVQMLVSMGNLFRILSGADREEETHQDP